MIITHVKFYLAWLRVKQKKKSYKRDFYNLIVIKNPLKLLNYLLFLMELDLSVK